jgi:hypothetical protein
VRVGAIIEATRHGEMTAVLMPPIVTAYDRVVAAGKIRPR